MLQTSYQTYLQVEKGYSPHTLQAYLKDLSDLNDFWQIMEERSIYDAEQVGNLDHKLLRLWMGNLIKRGLNTRSVARKCSSVKNYFHFLRLSGILADNPARLLRVPRFEQKLPVYLQEKETFHLLDSLNYADDFEGKRDHCMMELLYGCGLRRSELISLKYKDLDLAGMSLRVLGKGKKERVLPFGPTLKAAITAYLSELTKLGLSTEGVLLQRPDGQALYPELVYRRVRFYLEQLGSLSQNSPHVLRHTFATHLLNRGADLNAIKELLGHSSLAATQVYTHNNIEKLKTVFQQAHPRATKS